MRDLRDVEREIARLSVALGTFRLTSAECLSADAALCALSWAVERSDAEPMVRLFSTLFRRRVDARLVSLTVQRATEKTSLVTRPDGAVVAVTIPED